MQCSSKVCIYNEKKKEMLHTTQRSEDASYAPPDSDLESHPQLRSRKFTCPSSSRLVKKMKKMYLRIPKSGFKHTGQLSSKVEKKRKKEIPSNNSTCMRRKETISLPVTNAASKRQ